MKHENRKKQLLAHAMKVAEVRGFNRVTRQSVAERARVSPGLIQYHFHSMSALQDAVVDEAIRVENWRIIAQAIIASHPAALEVPPEIKRQAMRRVAV